MNGETLSEHGIARRQQILLLARREARLRRRRRLAGRGAVTLFIFVMALSLTLLRYTLTATSSHQLPTGREALIPQKNETAPPMRDVVVQYLQTDPTITDRLSVQPEPPKWTPIDDQELLTELAAAGQPAGLVSVHGKTILLLR
jgi:hypothetical protein